MYFTYDAGCYAIHTQTVEEIEIIAEVKFDIDAEFVHLLNRQVKP